MTMKPQLAALASFLVALAVPASATDIVIYTGGAPTGEGSTYHNGMGKAVEEVLAELSKPYGYTVRRIPSGGAVANANACGEESQHICFGIGQGGLTYEAVEAGRTQIIRNDLPGECAMAFTGEPRLPNWRSVIDNAARVSFVVPEGSGSEAFVRKVFATEPELQGVEPKFVYAKGSEAILKAVKATRGAVGVFYSYPNPTAGLIHEAAKADLTIMGILSPAVARTDSAYYLNRRAPYELSWLGLGKTRTVEAMCSKALLFAGDPARLTDEWAKGDYEEMVNRLRQLPASALVPKDGPLASLMRTVEDLSQEYGVNEMVDDLAKQISNNL